MSTLLKFISYLVIILLVVSCDTNQSNKIEQWKAEVIETESKFATMAKEKGVPAAFVEFADNHAVLMRNNNLIIGKEALQKYYESQVSDSNSSSLTWEPEFVEVSKSGDLAYTYGYYVFTFVDSTKTEIVSRGVFHTVWKRQIDGSWKFVWD